MMRFFTMTFLVSLLCCSCFSEMAADAPEAAKITEDEAFSADRLQSIAREAKAWCQHHKMDTGICLLADMRLHSGKKRLLVWDFKRNKVLAAGLVSHGCGDHPWGKDGSKDRPVFSNTPDSHCSSLGKYRIGARGYSQWGIHVKYLLHGMEPGNSNALSREIVLHGWDAIADEEVYPAGTPEGWGCPAVSNSFMTLLDGMLKDRPKPVLLWVFQ